MRRLTLLLLIASTVALAEGSGGGNGGDAVICPGKPPVFFDLVEASGTRGFSPKLPITPEGDERSIAQALIARIKGLNPTRAKRYEEWLKIFFKEVKFSTNQLVDIPDTGAAEIPSGCTIQQAIIQRKELLPGDKRYTIDKKIWDGFDRGSKAVAILHELILREAITDWKQDDSEMARYLNESIISDRLGSLQAYTKLLETTGFRSGDYGAFPIAWDANDSRCNVSFHSKNRIASACATGGTVSLPQGDLRIQPDRPTLISFDRAGQVILANRELNGCFMPGFKVPLHRGALRFQKMNCYNYLALNSGLEIIDLSLGSHERTACLTYPGIRSGQSLNEVCLSGSHLFLHGTALRGVRGRVSGASSEPRIPAVEFEVLLSRGWSKATEVSFDDNGEIIGSSYNPGINYMNE